MKTGPSRTQRRKYDINKPKRKKPEYLKRLSATVGAACLRYCGEHGMETGGWKVAHDREKAKAEARKANASESPTLPYVP